MELDPRQVIRGGLKLAERAGDEAYFATLCIRSGIVGLEPPRRIAKLLLAFERFGMLGGAVAVGAIRHGDRIAVIDERGELTYEQLHANSNAIANAWRERGFEPGEGIAILVRNHRGFLEAVFAAAKCGARVILLNTSFSGPQIREVARARGDRPARLRRRVHARSLRGSTSHPGDGGARGPRSRGTTRSTR